MQWIILKQCEGCHLCLIEFVFYLFGKAVFVQELWLTASITF